MTLRLVRFIVPMLAFTAGMAQQPQQPEKPAPATTESPENRKRVELNLLGKEDAAAGESRRNENIQFNLIDNNALKELNVRLGATATIVQAFSPDRSYFGFRVRTAAFRCFTREAIRYFQVARKLSLRVIKTAYSVRDPSSK